MRSRTTSESSIQRNSGLSCERGITANDRIRGLPPERRIVPTSTTCRCSRQPEFRRRCRGVTPVGLRPPCVTPRQRHTTISTGRGSTYRGRNTVSTKPATSPLGPSDLPVVVHDDATHAGQHVTPLGRDAIERQPQGGRNVQPLGASADAKAGFVEMLDGCADNPLVHRFGETPRLRRGKLCKCPATRRLIWPMVARERLTPNRSAINVARRSSGMN